MINQIKNDKWVQALLVLVTMAGCFASCMVLLVVVALPDDTQLTSPAITEKAVNVPVIDPPIPTSTVMPLETSTEIPTQTPEPTSTLAPTEIPTDVPTQIPLPTETPDPFPKFTDGMHEVIKDIEPGLYRTRKGSSGCYYARLSGFSGEIDDILANENTDYPAIIEILPSDRGFESSRCGTWTQNISQITNSKIAFSDGTYIVGVDIEPGIYKNLGGTGCYYARLSGFTGEIEDIISNGNTHEQVMIDIAASDKGFQSSRCGTWERK